MNQLYMDLRDIIPTEGLEVEFQPIELCADKDEFGKIHAYQWLDDIEKNGIKHPLKVRPDGRLGDGNFRYWCLKELYSKTNNPKWLKVPIDLWYYLGMERNMHITIRKEILKHAPQLVHAKREVISSNNDFPEIDMESLGKGENPYSAITDFIVLKV